MSARYRHKLAKAIAHLETAKKLVAAAQAEQQAISDRMKDGMRNTPEALVVEDRINHLETSLGAIDKAEHILEAVL